MGVSGNGICLQLWPFHVSYYHIRENPCLKCLNRAWRRCSLEIQLIFCLEISRHPGPFGTKKRSLLISLAQQMSSDILMWRTQTLDSGSHAGILHHFSRTIHHHLDPWTPKQKNGCSCPVQKYCWHWVWMQCGLQASAAYCICPWIPFGQLA